MSIAEIERFVADLKSNEALRVEAEKAEAGMSPETPLANAVVFAATKGYAFTDDDMKAYVKARADAAGTELTDAQLGGIVGGAGVFQQLADQVHQIGSAVGAAALETQMQQISAEVAKMTQEAGVGSTGGMVSGASSIAGGTMSGSSSGAKKP